MINKIKLYIILGLIGLIVGLIVYYSTTYTFIKKKEVKQKIDSISTLKVKVKTLDSTVFSIQQDLDICNNNTGKAQINQRQLNDENKQLKLEIKRLDEALGHYEENGLMRYFVFDNKGWFQKGCFKEQFEKPDNICK